MLDTVPSPVREYADQAVAYVQRALGIKLEYDSDTLPVLDHYLRTVPDDQPAALQLVMATSGAYFGEVIRQRLGGRWELGSKETEWRIVLPTGINFSPMGFVAAAIAKADLDDLDSELTAPPRMLPYLQQALSRMGEVSVDDYYSLCGRLDTLEHVHEVLVAVAARMMGDATDDDDLPDDLPSGLADDQAGDLSPGLASDLRDGGDGRDASAIDELEHDFDDGLDEDDEDDDDDDDDDLTSGVARELLVEPLADEPSGPVN